MTKNEAIKEPTDKMKLYEQIIQKDNIIQAINKIKSNQGSRTPGVDGKVMTDLLSEGVNKLVEEIQSKSGYVLFTAVNKQFLASISNVNTNQALLRITPVDNNYYFQPGIISNIFKYIDLNINTKVQNIELN